ncbi:MAG TPA: TetR/AcrR family transcriptional regulator [Novosphingobium sp.]
MGRAAGTDTREAIITAATVTVMTDGYNALSFRDLASDVGIKSASVHHHFPTKGDLAKVLVERFCEGFVERMEPLTALSFEEAIDGYVALFRTAFVGRNRMCLAGMMSAEVSALPKAAQQRLEDFVEAHKAFLRAALAKKYKRMAADQLDARAIAIFAAMEGAQLVVRGLGGDIVVFDGIIESYRSVGLLS